MIELSTGHWKSARRPNTVFCLCTVAALTVTAFFSSSTAQEGRVLGGYRFIPSTTIADPFITTHFRNATGLASTANVDIPLLIFEGPPPDTLLSIEGDFLFISAEAEYSQVVHPKVLVRLAGTGASRVGTSGQSLVSQGVTASFGGGAGTKIELWRSDTMLLSGAADLGFGQNLLIDLLQYAEDVIDNGIEDASILRKETGVILSAGLCYAWALNHWSGITVTGDLGYTNLEGRNQDALWRVGGTYGMDFGQKEKKPIGLLLHLEADRMSQRILQAGTIVDGGLGVYFTGREDFNIGLEYQISRVPLQNWDIVVYPSSFVLALRYYF